MSYTRGNLADISHSIDVLRNGPVAPQSTPGSATWPTANMAIYVPVLVPARVVVRTLWFGASTTGTGNYDLGLYDAAGSALLRRGSTAHPASGDEEVWDCTDTTIGPGIYYMALAVSNTTDTVSRYSLTAPICAGLGVYSEASALPLPATATLALNQTLAFVPVMGMFMSSIPA